MDDGIVWVSFIAIWLIIASLIVGVNLGRHQYTPSPTFRAVCRVQGGEPYKHVTADGAFSTCIKNGTTIPIVIP